MKGFIIWVAGSVVIYFLLYLISHNPNAPVAMFASAVVLFLKGRWDEKLDHKKKFSALEGAGYKFDVKVVDSWISFGIGSGISIVVGSGISFGYDSQKNEYVFIYKGGQPIVISGYKLIDAELSAKVRGTQVRTTTIKFAFKDPQRPTVKLQFPGNDGERVYDKLRACEAIT